jgi:hypothetical protein
MSDEEDIPTSLPHRDADYQDLRDDEDALPADDSQPRRTRPPAQRKPNRRPPPRRWHEDD